MPHRTCRCAALAAAQFAWRRQNPREPCCGRKNYSAPNLTARKSTNSLVLWGSRRVFAHIACNGNGVS
jgi:hypothetical protein